MDVQDKEIASIDHEKLGDEICDTIRKHLATLNGSHFNGVDVTEALSYATGQAILNVTQGDTEGITTLTRAFMDSFLRNTVPALAMTVMVNATGDSDNG